MALPQNITRAEALAARPVATKIVRRHPLENGGQQITVALESRGYRRWLLRLPKKVERTVELDVVGVAVRDRCDGKTTVHDIITGLSSSHQLDSVEAEKAVTTFLRMLLQRGIVAMVVTSRPEPRCHG